MEHQTNLEVFLILPEILFDKQQLVNTTVYLSHTKKPVRLEVGEMTEDVAKETPNDAEKGDVVETDKTSVVNGDVGDCPVGEQLHLVNNSNHIFFIIVVHINIDNLILIKSCRLWCQHHMTF